MENKKILTFYEYHFRGKIVYKKGQKIIQEKDKNDKIVELQNSKNPGIRCVDNTIPLGLSLQPK